MHKSSQNTANPFISEEASENYSNADFLYEQSARNAIKFFPPKTDAAVDLKIVDLGAGTGVSAKALIEAGAKDITLVDPSLVMLQQAEKKISSAATYIQAGAENFSTHFNNDVELVYALNCFHLFSDMPSIFAQLKQACKPQAHFVFNLSMPSLCFENLSTEEYLSAKANRDFYHNLAAHAESQLITNTVNLFDKILSADTAGLVNKQSIESLFDLGGFKLVNYAEYPIEGDAAAQKVIWELISTCLVPDKEERVEFLNNQYAPEKMFFRQAFFDMLVNND